MAERTGKPARSVVYDIGDIDENLGDEIAEFHRERARIRKVMGQIGGVQYSKVDSIINIVFITLVVSFFAVELIFHPLPTTLSIEIGVFLVSIKMVWMIHANQKFNHFVFWLLNTMEYRLNANARSLDELSAAVRAMKARMDEGGLAGEPRQAGPEPAGAPPVDVA